MKGIMLKNGIFIGPIRGWTEKKMRPLPIDLVEASSYLEPAKSVPGSQTLYLAFGNLYITQS